MNPREAVVSILRRWPYVVAGVLVGALAGYLASLLTPPTYRASISMYISAQYPGDNASAAYQGSLLTAQRIASYTQLVESTRVGGQVARNLGLPDSPSQVAEYISASAVPDSVLLNIDVRTNDPQKSVSIANAAADEFSRLVAELERPLDSNRPPIVVARTVEAAVPPAPQVSPNTFLNLVVGAFVGILIGMAVAWWRASLDTTLRSSATLAEVSGAPVLGTIPQDTQVREDSSMVLREGSSITGESLRELRTNLQFVNIESDSKVIAITSCAPGDGKTFTSINLAHALAIAGFRTLLIEADLRRPRISSRLGLESNVGLTTVLTRRAQLSDCLQLVAGALNVLTSGELPPNPSELLGSNSMFSLVEEAKGRFDYVMIDTPPVLAVTDAAQLSPSVDAALLVCRWGETTRNMLGDSVAALRKVDLQLAGCVFNGAPLQRRSYQYGSYYSDAMTPSPDGASAARTTANESQAATTELRGSPPASAAYPSRPTPGPRRS
ncbi:polysaccharide biosynthesis tyrosine autokinase [Actinomycetospora aurantiaca]|uniref:polysaccharide biosynthesis tyrosine autokinase n=1 Tax=Actinomycetospora aurantiaca TaxID=3129233 RepID=UPI0035A0E88F